MLPSPPSQAASGQRRDCVSDITAAIETLQQPVLVLRSDLTAALANRAFLECFGVDEADILDRRLSEVGNGQWQFAGLLDLLERLHSDDSGEIENYRINCDCGTLGRRIMLVNARRLREQPDRERILVAITDVTQRECLESELSARAEFAEKLVHSVRDALLVLDRRFVVETANQSFYDMFQVDPEEVEGRLLYDIGEGQWRIPALREALEEILPQHATFDDFEVIHDFPRIGRRAMLLNGRQLDHMPRILLAIRDETERRRNQAEQKIMIGELQHRVKNILSNVQAIATSTLRRSASLENFEDAFLQRLSAVARTQDLLMRGPSGEADLRQLVEAETTAHGWTVNDRLSLEGPAVALSRREAQAVAMVIHELATNAVKHGAFSKPKGSLVIAWRAAAEGARTHLTFEWRESGIGLKGQPDTRGFGTGLIENSIHHMLGGETSLDFTPSGVVCRLMFALGKGMGGGEA